MTNPRTNYVSIQSDPSEMPYLSDFTADLVSVVVPVYKVETLLPRCIDSVLAQTYSNFELILVDDGSPDGSGKICDEYAAMDARVIVVHQPNGGVSVARNTGLGSSRGEFVTFIDSDDWVSPNYIEVLLEMARQADAEIAIGSFLKVHDPPEQTISHPKYELEKLTVLEALTGLYGQREVQMVVVWGKLYRRHLFVNTRFPAGRIHEDVFVSCRLICAAKSVVTTTQPLYFYLQRDGSIMRTMKATYRSLRDRFDAFSDNVDVLRAAGFDHHAKLALIRAILAYSRLFANYPPKRLEGAGEWSREEAERIRRTLARDLSRSAARPRLRLYLLLHLHAPRLAEEIARRIR